MQDLVITRRGQELMAKMIAGTSTATFTKIATSSYDYSGTNLEELLQLYDIKQEALVSRVTRTDLTLVEVLAAINNSVLTEGYHIRGLGLYAKDSDNNEILYGVSTENQNPDYMPPFGGRTVSGVSYRLNTKVDNSEQVTLEINPAAIPTITQVEAIQVSLNTHIAKTVYGEDGVHGFRFFDDVLQFWDAETEAWIEIETGGGGIAPSNVIDPRIKIGNSKLTVFWSDPGDTVVEGQVISTWKGTKLVQKVGAYPESIKDGMLLVDNQVLDAYAVNGFEITGLNNGTTYYFALFPYSDKNAVNQSEANRLSGIPQPYKTMTARIDLTNSNPSTSITYLDDANGMTPGNVAWDDFFGHYPVLLQNGVEIGKLNKNNFAQFEGGSAADITSGNAGDVMVAFPRRGVKITTVGTILTISMTDDPDNTDFQYMAHTRGSTRKEKFYLGTYKGYTTASRLRSLSGKAITATQTIGTFRTQAQANGSGYDQSGFYQLTFRQVMYLLKYRNLNSQTALGRGYVDANTAAIITGGTNAKGMDFGETTGKLQMKLFGLEDFWGNVYEWIDGIFSDSVRNILTATTSFNDTGSGYTNNGQGATADIGGYMSKPQGTTNTGFVAKEVNGSETTYFCDYTNLYASRVAYFGGNWSNASDAGAFRLTVADTASGSAAAIAARLMFL